ncbi:MAG: toll/interleukin-1 receptor domain-containing protein, partial [Saprospiraceae bacterium]
MNQPAPLKTFIVYSSKDRELREQLESHLRALVDLEWITLWSDKEIAPGERWDKAIKDRLLDTEIFLMLVSVDFYNSGYIREEEFKTAITRLDSGDSMVIPIIVRPCDWESYPVIKDLQVLPPGGYAVTDTDHWKDRDKAWHTIAKKLRERIQELRAERLAADSTAERESARLHALRTEQERERHRQEAHNAAWAAASEQHSAAAYQQFLAAYPDSTNAREARHRIKTLRQADRQPLAWRQWAGIGAGVLALALLVWALNRDSVGVTLSHPD